MVPCKDLKKSWWHQQLYLQVKDYPQEVGLMRGMVWTPGCRRCDWWAALWSLIESEIVAFLSPFSRPSCSCRQQSMVSCSSSGKPFRTWFSQCSAGFRFLSSRSNIFEATCYAQSPWASASRSGSPRASFWEHSFHSVAFGSIWPQRQWSSFISPSCTFLSPRPPILGTWFESRARLDTYEFIRNLENIPN